jgi:cytoskeletal protein RodZ
VILRRESTSRQGVGAGAEPASLLALGRSLRRARTLRGLRLTEAASRTGIDPGVLESLEAGTVRSTDPVSSLRAVRRYADFLGLPGDRYALSLMEFLPSGATPAPVDPEPVPVAATPVVARTPDPVPEPTDRTGVVATTAAPSAGPATMAVAAFATAASAAVLDDPTVTAAVSAQPRTATHRSNGGGRFEDTGVTPAYAPSHYRGRPRSTGILVFMVVVVLLLVLVGSAGLAINHWKPQWLAAAHLPHSGYAPAGLLLSTVSTTTTQPPTSTTAAHGAATHVTTTTAHGTSRGHTSTTTALVSVASTSSEAATISVRSPTFTVTVAAVGGASWTQVTDNQHQAPIYSQTIQSGQSQTFSATQALTVEVGSSAAQLTVNIGGKPVGAPYVPQNAPFTITYQTVS